MPTSIDAIKEKGRLLRILSLKATTEAGSGHPSSCLSAADLMSVIFFHEMQYDPKDPHNPANDRFVLSKGHAAPLLWAAYAEAGIIDEKDVPTLRRLDSVLEGHPTPRMRWVDVATGSLGQGLSVGLGNAFAAKLDGLPFNTYVLLGDGECAEGSVWEAAALAGYYKASNLYAVVDVNGLGQSQRTMDQFDVNRFADKFRAFGWFAQTVDGHDYAEILRAFDLFRSDGGTRPRALLAKTLKGKGVSLIENREVGTVKRFLNKICRRHCRSWRSPLAQTNSFRDPVRVSQYRHSTASSTSQSRARPGKPPRHAKLTVTRW